MAIKKAARTKPGMAAVIVLPFLGIALVYLQLIDWAIVIFLLFAAALVFYYVDRDREVRRSVKHDMKREEKYQEYRKKRESKKEKGEQ